MGGRERGCNEGALVLSGVIAYPVNSASYPFVCQSVQRGGTGSGWIIESKVNRREASFLV